MRSDRLYLADIMEAANDVSEFTQDRDRDAFMKNKLLKSAVLQKLTVIGEAASRISKETREKYPDVEWKDIAAFRNIAVHEYFSMDWDIVWRTALKNVPDVGEKINRIMEKEFRKDA
jgi:uncharacterized protein with HEPN domain